jgi:hypothetical protein
VDARRPYAARRNVVDQRFKAAGGFRADAALSACSGLYPIVTFQYSSTILYQVSYHIQYRFF